MERVSNLLTGYVTIRVEGFFIERFINICISKRILLHNIQREKSTLLYANISINNYRRIKEVAKKTKTTVKITNKVGLPFVMHKYRKRKIFGVFFLIIFVGIIVLSNYIWNIDIEGNINITEEEILTLLEENGLYIGIAKDDINTKSIINKIRLSRKDIGWIGINIEGTNAIIKVKEADIAPELIDKDEYCNIVSDKEGIITQINVQSGTAVVKEGDVIKKGDLLVEGIMQGTYSDKRYVHSSADIQARVWYSKKCNATLNTQIPVLTGNEEKRYSMNIKNFKINFYKTLSKFKKYDTIDTNKKIALFSNFYLPIEIVKTINKEYVMQDITYTEEELTEITVNKLKEELKQEIQNDENIIDTQVNTYSYDGYIEVEVIFEVLENIGTKDKIIF